ncbi:MAG: hypothetical protein D6778_05550 [Nitrospirae bacterium]|nr:MAG: hypothetical protein D6778_05550 [Nitrospirota bacterium]
MTDKLILLKKDLSDFKETLKWLRRSISRCKPLVGKPSDDLSEEEIERVEALMARFSRSIDFIINRLLRGIDIVELEEPGSRLDIVIRAEKRGFIEDYKELIVLKDLRNELSHEYVGDELVEKIEEVLRASEKVIEVGEKIVQYIEKTLLPKISS